MKRALKWANNAIVDMGLSLYLPPWVGFGCDTGWVFWVNALDFTVAFATFVVGIIALIMVLAYPLFAQAHGEAPIPGEANLPPQWAYVFTIMAMLLHAAIKDVIGPLVRSRTASKPDTAASGEIRLLEQQIRDIQEDQRRTEEKFDKIKERFEEDRRRMEKQFEDDIRRVVQSIEDRKRSR